MFGKEPWVEIGQTWPATLRVIIRAMVN